MGTFVTPKIVGLVDSNLNCVYAASVKNGVTTVKHLIIPAKGEIPTGTFAYVEISGTGYSIKPVKLTNSLTSNFEKVTGTTTEQKPEHWALNWFKADYTRWAVLNEFTKTELKETKALAEPKVKSLYTNPTTGFIQYTNPTTLLAAHVGYAYCVDAEAGDVKYKPKELLNLYIEKFNLIELHGRAFTKTVIGKMDKWLIEEIVAKNPKYETFGVDTFVTQLIKF